MNSLKRMLDVLHPEVEGRVKLWTSRSPGNESAAAGDCLDEITVLLRAKLRDYIKAIGELLTANVRLNYTFSWISWSYESILSSHYKFLALFLQTKLQKTTRLKTILQEAKNHTESTEIINRMQPLINLLAETVVQLNDVFETRVFIQVTRAFWNRMGQVILMLNN